MQILLCTVLAAAPVWELTTSLSYVYNTSPASQGGVWCASSGGAFHYSPSQGLGTVYSCPEHLPLPDCRDILEDSAGRLWFATGGDGLVMFDGEQWYSYSGFEGIPGQGTVTALVEADGEIWVGCYGGFAHGDASGFTPVGDAFAADDVYSLSARNDTIWVCSDKGVFTLLDTENPLNPASWRYWPETDRLRLRRVRVGASSVYACGDTGVLELLAGEETFTSILDYSAAEDSSVIDVMETPEGLLAACHGTILRRSGEDWNRLGSGIPSFFWPTCLFTVEGQLHAGFTVQTVLQDLVNTQAGLGFYLLSGDSWSNFPIPGMQCMRVHQSDMTEDGRLYLGTYLTGVQAYYPGYGWRSYLKEDGLPNNVQTFALAADPAGGVWASSYHRGLSWIMDNGDWEEQGDTILTFFRDSLENPSPQATLIQAPIPNNQPVMITSQSNGLWAAFEQYDPVGSPDESSGILGFNGDPLNTMNWGSRELGSGIASINTRSVFPVSGDSLWIAFKDGGCQLLVHSGNPSDTSEDSWSPGSGQAYTESSGLPSSDVFCFSLIPGTGLIAGTGYGLARWTGSGFTEYGEIYEPVRAMAADQYGRLWCLSESGVYTVVDGVTAFYDSFNSDFRPSTPFTWEYALSDPVNGGVLFSSINGLWHVSQAGGGGGTGSGISFYPQPFLPGESSLRVAGVSGSDPVSVDFFRLDGSYAGSLDASSAQEWAWDGTLRSKVVSSGVYFVTVTFGAQVFHEKITVVR